EARMLGAATLFSEGIPVPVTALAVAGAANGCKAPDQAISRLLGLGLFDSLGELRGHRHAAANALARPLAPTIADSRQLARAATPKRAAAWTNATGRFQIDARSVDAAHLAISADADLAIIDSAARAAARFLYEMRQDVRRAHDLAQAAICAIRER